MKWHRCVTVMAAMALAVTAGGADGAIQIDLVTVGNPGNAADSTGYGAVGYDYRIGKYEVTNAQYREFLRGVATQGDPFGLYNVNMAGTYGGIARSGSGTADSPYVYSANDGDANWDTRPVTWVSWYDAARFTNWMTSGDTKEGVYRFGQDGRFLGIDRATAEAMYGQTYWIPTEDEWYKAAYHKNDGVTGNYWLYPTCSDSVPSNRLTTPDLGNSANFYLSDYTIGSPYWMTEVGEFTNSDGPYGTFDQGGNVWEWNETAVTSSSRGLRGGYWSLNSETLLASNRYRNDPTIEHIGIGFRVASVPEPGSIMLMLCGALAGFLGLRRKRHTINQGPQSHRESDRRAY